MTRAWLRVCSLSVIGGVLGHVGAAAAQSIPDLSNLSLEQLLRVEVTSVSRKPQSLASAPAAVVVITQDDIQRSGAATLPEALRLAPGLQVARYSNSKWSVGARGMGTYYSNKLLVLIDGRSVYMPDFSGVYWDAQDMMLEDIERIEVIRGPGGTMWGANAVNGVINIVSKAAAATAGDLVVVRTGTEDSGVVAARHGGSLGGIGVYRVYGQFADRAFDRADGLPDRSSLAHGGFRFDRSRGTNTVTLQARISGGHERTIRSVPQLTPPYAAIAGDSIPLREFNVSARVSGSRAPGRSLTLSADFNHTVRDEFIHTYQISTVNVEAQHRFQMRERHDFGWGVQYREAAADIGASDLFVYDPSRSRRQLASVYAQDEIRLTPRLALTVGSKLEWHTRTGVAVEPNLRAIWSLSPDHALWAATSQGVRTPSLAEQIATFKYKVLPPSAASANLPVEIEVVGNPLAQRVERVTAYEIGYRVRPLETLAVDLAAYRNIYVDLSSYSRGSAAFSMADGIPHLILQSQAQNLAAGESEGLEVNATWTPSGRISAGGSLVLQDLHLRMTDSSIDPGETFLVLSLSPRTQASIRAQIHLGRGIAVNGIFTYVGPLQMGGVGSYTRTDARIGWTLSKAIGLDLGVQNMLDAQHLEAAPFLYETPSDIRRSAYVRVSWRSAR